MRLVADIGGTNTRLALTDANAAKVESARGYRNADYACFEDVILAFFDEVGACTPEQIVVAMAGPVSGNAGKLTNLDWVIDGAALSTRFCGATVRIINDLTALGHAAFHLQASQLVPLVANDAPQHQHRQALVVGIGTGFNVSPAIDLGTQTVCPPVEAGHTSLYASVTAELENLKPGLSAAFPTVEALFSGRGRRRFLSLLTDETVERATPYIATAGHAGNERFDAALDSYAHLIGVLLRELKVAYLPSSGIFLAGGVARSSLVGERAEICFSALSQENEYVSLSPSVWIIDDDAAALTGCASLVIGSPERV